MDWSNEDYVRLYVRDTDDWLLLPWQSRALLPLMMRRMDRAGVIETKRGARGIAVLVHLPAEVVEVGLQGLLEDGCVMEHSRGFVMPNFLTAQEASKSDKQRAKESRDRRRTSAIDDSHTPSRAVTSGHERSQDDTKRDGAVTKRDASVTNRDQTSRAVTSGHTASQPVTLTSLSSASLPSEGTPPARDPVTPEMESGTRSAEPGTIAGALAEAITTATSTLDVSERRRAIGNRLWDEHRDRHEALRAKFGGEHKLNLHGPGRDYLGRLLREEFPTLEGAEDACRAYLRKREQQAIAREDVAYFGDDVWHRDEWAKRGRLDAKPRAGPRGSQLQDHTPRPKFKDM